MKMLSLKVPEALDVKLTAIARRRGTSKSTVIREALERLPAGEDAQPESVLALARDLAGCIAGPPDLSWHRMHMRGYGR